MAMVGGGGYLRDKNTCARTSTENVGRKGGVYAGRYGTCTINLGGKIMSIFVFLLAATAHFDCH